MKIRFVFFFLLLIATPGFVQTPIAERPRIVPAGIDGTLMLCGQDSLTDAAVDTFIEKAGGAKASIVVLGAEKDDGTTERLRLRLKEKEIPGVFLAAKATDVKASRE